MTRPIPLLLSLGLALALSCCAYTQVHKNVEEQGRIFKGHQFAETSMVYHAGGQWFLAAAPAEFRLHHPTVHDSVFQGQTETEMRLVGTVGSALAYHPVSAGTAKVLMREDGYAELQTLADELKTYPGSWRSELPGARAYPIRAQVVGKPVAITSTATPEHPTLGTRVLSSLVFVGVDVPGTVLYNVAIPFAAPFVFFGEFISGS